VLEAAVVVLPLAARSLGDAVDADEVGEDDLHGGLTMPPAETHRKPRLLFGALDEVGGAT
jgi:hypothetical protein